MAPEYERSRPRGVADHTFSIRFSTRYITPTASSNETFLSSSAAALRKMT